MFTKATGKRKRDQDEGPSFQDLTDAYMSLNQQQLSKLGTLPLMQAMDLLKSFTNQGAEVVRKAAGEFSFSEVVQTFGLSYSERISHAARHTWDIEKHVVEFDRTPCLASLMDNYTLNFDRSTEAGCRTMLDTILNECLTVMKGNHKPSQPSTPTPYSEIKIFGELSFSYSVPSAPQGTLVTGRIDHGIGRVLSSHHNYKRRRFQSLLFIVEAKSTVIIEKATPQLLTYLASLRGSRQERGRTDCSVYGVATDGYKYCFVTITHDGAIKLSRQFDISRGELDTVLGSLKYILQLTSDMSPNVTPEKPQDVPNTNVDVEDPEDDTLIDLDHRTPRELDDSEEEDV